MRGSHTGERSRKRKGGAWTSSSQRMGQAGQVRGRGLAKTRSNAAKNRFRSQTEYGFSHMIDLGEKESIRKERWGEAQPEKLIALERVLGRG